MTTTIAPTGSTFARRLRTDRRLRGVLALNAATSPATGGAGLVAGGWWAERLGVEDRWIAVGSAGLVVFALAVASTVVTPSAHLRRWAVAVSVGDVAWVAGTVAVLAAGALTRLGTGVAVVLAVGVAGFAATQLALARAAHRGAPDPY